MLKVIAGLWIGSHLSDLEQVCIQSFLDFGHRFVLYGYEKIENAPKGTELRDAREVFDSGEILRHRKSGSPALHSDLFRYQLCAKTDFVYVDLDMLALRPFDMADDYILGWQDSASINGAVLGLPNGSELLEQLKSYTGESFGYPPYLGKNRQLERWIKSIFQRGPIHDWPWGSLGPKLLTYHAQKTGEAKHAAEIDAFYPISFGQTAQLLEPNALDYADLGTNSYAVHLWASRLRQIQAKDHGGAIPPDSFLAKAIKRHPFQTERTAHSFSA